MALLITTPGLLSCPVPPRPTTPPRAQDGAGFCSRACWSAPRGPNRLGPLRKAWCSRILDTSLHAKVCSALGSGYKDPPLSDHDLLPFLSDLRSFLGDVADPVWNFLMSVPPGQPFRVHLWKILMEVIADPDASFLDLLPGGVPLGVDPAAPVPACPVLSLADRIPANRPPLT